MKNTNTLIGITGNIATGKSVVRRMLANAGALGLDADVIAHRMIYPQGPAFQDVLAAFGEEILDPNGEISRARLGKIVFQNPSQLAKLESIVHPAVATAIHKRLDLGQTPLAALEAIKLLEAGLGKICDSVWISHAPPHIQLERLLQTRGLREDEARARINAQAPPEEKLNRADVVINTDGPFERTWVQVIEGFNDTIQEKRQDFPNGISVSSVFNCPTNELLKFWEVRTGKSLAGLYEALGMQMVQPFIQEGRLRALLLWTNWNFTATLTHVHPNEALLKDFATLIDTFKEAALRQECELLLLPDELVQDCNLKPGVMGFRRQRPLNLPYPAWQSAAKTLGVKGWVWSRVLSRPLEAENNFQLK